MHACRNDTEYVDPLLVLTGEELERRGYVDLHAGLYDLPIFDFARRAGASGPSRSGAG